MDLGPLLALRSKSYGPSKMWELGVGLRQHECLFICTFTSIPFVNVWNEYYYDYVHVWCSVASLIKVKIKVFILMIANLTFCRLIFVII